MTGDDQTEQKYEGMTPLALPALLAQKLDVTEDDAPMLLALDLASARFRGQTNNPISLTTETVTLDAHGTRTLLLPFTPLVDVQALAVGGVTYGPGGFEWSAAGILRFPDPIADRWRTVELTCTHGYAEIPQDVQEAVLDQATAMYPVLSGNAYTSYTTGTESRSFNTQLQVGYSAQWSACVQKYRVTGSW
ncbi:MULTISPECIES: mobile element protein [Bifidobacterium]|uniref:Mobile element protein n=1 Tax=Bifidobacterium tibiigranuli TaxID=2172043 RepID=A0A5N6SBC2_9BIFI|nr:mobile element protein [Bifidobacterium tibiigranuli]KAE8130217.1 mobile element protein [Bifidobacterium tibiigranuli]KAE8130424.1 mobile element protein [Bifidobacterium tibiigranuli]